MFLATFLKKTIFLHFSSLYRYIKHFSHKLLKQNIMKTKNLLLLIVLFISFTFSVKGQSDPIDYNDNILSYYTELDSQIAKFATSLANNASIDDLEDEYTTTLDIYNDNYQTVYDIDPHKDDAGFHAAIIAFYDGVKYALDKEYKKILDYYRADDWDESYSTIIDELSARALNRLINLEENVIKAQENFAEENGINLE